MGSSLGKSRVHGRLLEGVKGFLLGGLREFISYLSRCTCRPVIIGATSLEEAMYLVGSTSVGALL